MAEALPAPRRPVVFGTGISTGMWGSPHNSAALGMSMDRPCAALVTLQGGCLVTIKRVIASAGTGHRQPQGRCSSVMDACWCGQLLLAGMQLMACKPAFTLGLQLCTAATARPEGTQRT